ncbi:OmpH family outer membrane protein [Porphyromonadaceae bacterium OttesenSCG-928-L07]|nr:OmpH family outer membrane protein [Porphyromonadaceae bacterium OttesenSCG-928-L07]MDL2251886.1 OmpH family outer membrane protein [Odoribacter sp. OttesenSCG-928-J03]MDL2283385.1 OmpH family outer membrane protein [Odoribacter sp. OttesenSCG-928-G04]
MMKNSMKWLATMVFVLFVLGASAQSAIKLGHIESDKLIAAMPEMEKAKTTLESKQAEIEKEMMNLREQYQTKITEYSQNRNTYSDIIRTSKEQELEELGQRIQRFEEIASNEFRKSQEDLLRPIMDKATNAIREVAKENGFTYIFDLNSGAILYNAENSTDILPLVKKKLNIQ